MTTTDQITAALEASDLSARLIITSHLLEDAAYSQSIVINALKSKGRCDYDNTPDRARKAENACMAVLVRNLPRTLELIAAKAAARAAKNAAGDAAAAKLGWI